MSEEDGGSIAVPVDPPYTSQGFLSAAQQFAQAAVANFTPRDEAFFYLHAGASVELGIKAALCRVSPALLVEGQPRHLNEALVRLVGYQPAPRSKGGGAATRSRPPFTVGFSGAVDRFELLYGEQSLGVARSEIDELKAARDLAAHGSQTSAAISETMHRVLTTLATVYERLLPLLEIEPREFWGSHHRTIERAIEGHKDTLRAQLQVLYSAARARFESHYAGVARESLEPLLEEAFWARDPEPDEWARTCPVCRAQGTSHLRAEKRTAHEGSKSKVLRGWKAIDFRCSVCNLVLETEQLVDAAVDFEAWESADDDLDLWAEDFGVDLPEDRQNA